MKEIFGSSLICQIGYRNFFFFSLPPSPTVLRGIKSINHAKLLGGNAVGGFVQESMDSYLALASVRRIIIEQEATRTGETHALPMGRVH